MDRPLDESVRRKKTIKRGIQAGAGVGTAALLVAVISGWLSPSLNRQEIRTAVVDVGPVEATITASGIIVPESEQIIASPIDSRVVHILRRPGDVLAAGDPIIELDTATALLALSKIDDELSLNANSRSQLELELESQLDDLRSKFEIDSLKLQALRAKTEQLRKLFKIGGSSAEQVHQVELETQIAEVELAQTKRNIAIKQKTLEAQLAGTATQRALLRKEQTELRRQLNMAAARALRGGVLTWVVPQEGTAVREGDVIARIADLSTFRVDATISDVHANRIAAGMPAKVKILDSVLAGEITSIRPTIENGIISFGIGLRDNASPLLHSNQRVDVFVVTAAKDTALRVKRGPSANGRSSSQVFVIRDGVAINTPVRLGITGFEYVEVEEGLARGDIVIISDVSEFMHRSKIKVR
ncbi:MAG: HlyD family efflux transporter periplasmic adaptor subunit [candidate division Zixibacteria bacterium]|nr:HlyD family efflux transporter periplasmic adaptor subunit [candidate division Zixibacteria bacterium]